MTEVKVTSQKNTKTLTFKGLTDGQIISMMNALQHWGFEMGSPVAARLPEFIARRQGLVRELAEATESLG